ncbi:hypothetical protein PMSD_25080 [Paenibacillus macquariensis subsp. defensor]|nr:hypothetical protein PMSD_25080 [Paenibacillus macquariensis subsp. defensor]
MNEPKSLTDYAYLFIKGKISEEEYVNKHPKNSRKISWEETPDIIRNPALAYQYLSTFKEPGNRRRALSESMGINATKLEYLFKCGSTTATGLLRATIRRFDSNLLARYAIVHRSTYSMANAVHINSRWDFHAFDHLSGCTITRDSFSQLIIVKGNESWSIEGYILKSIGIDDIYLRVEKKSNLVVVDLMNPSKSTYYSMSKVLLTTNQSWYFLELPSFSIGHMFYVFVCGQEEEVSTYIKNQFGKRPCYKLTTMYSGFK